MANAEKRDDARPFVVGASNFLSRWSLVWVLKLIVKSATSGPDAIVFALEPQQTAEATGDALQRAIRQHPGNLQRALISAFGASYALLGVFKIVWGVCTWGTAYYVLEQMMRHPSHSLAFALLGATVIGAIAIQRLFTGTFAARAKIRSALTAQVFQKSLLLSSRHVQVGSIVNLVSTDIEAVADCAMHVHFLWSGTIETISVLVIAVIIAGVSSAVSIAIVLLTVPVQLYIGYLVSAKSSVWIANSGKRVHLMTEVLTAVKLIKFYTWEAHFAERVRDVRQIEASAAARQIWLRAANFAVVMGAPVMAALGCLLFMQLSGAQLDAVTAFTLLSLFNTLRYPLFSMPMAVKSLASARNALASLSTFFELSENADQRVVLDDDASRPAIEFANATLHWDGLDSPTLDNVNVSVRKGEILAVVGDIGSGKSSLLAAILGQMDIRKGTVTVQGRVSYCPQEAWLLNETVFDNIVFGSAYDAARYERVIDVCQLKSDFQMFDGGDRMKISERGANLSGGQRQRISLARAVYSNSEIILLDDPLSALDQQVGRAIFDRCFREYLSDRAVVLVTHGLQYLPQCSAVAVMADGGVREYGTCSDLMAIPNGVLATLMAEHTDIDVDDVDEDENAAARGVALPKDSSDDEEYQGPRRRRSKEAASDSTSTLRRRSLERVRIDTAGGRHELLEMTAIPSVAVAAERGDEPSDSGDFEALLGANQMTLKRVSMLNSSLTVNAEVLCRKAELDHMQVGPYARTVGGGTHAYQTTLINNELLTLTAPAAPAEQGEDLQEPGVRPSPLRRYLSLEGGLGQAIGIIVLFFAVHGLRLMGDVWVKVWQGSNGDGLKETFSLGPVMDSIVYSVLGVLFTLGVLLRGHWLARATAAKARRLHDDMVESLLTAPMEFYDRTPLGAILQSSSKHQADADDRLPDAALQFLMYLPLAVGAIMVVIWQSPRPVYVLLVVAGMAVFVAILIALPKMSGVITHCENGEAVAKPLLFSHVATSLEGIFSIRAFSMEARFKSELFQHLDSVASYQMALQSVKSFVALYVDVACAVIVYSSALLFVEFPTSASTIGLALSNALQLVIFVQWTLRMFEEVMSSVSSVDALRSFGDGSVPAEAPAVVESELLDDDWPDSGLITFRNVVLRYTRYGVAVLKRVNFVIKPREKVGIVGRTGSGKSTLLVALLRIVELSGGKIFVDNVDISRIGLRDLRKRIAIIPQEPVVFGGTVRSNLDPYDEYDDAAMWHALGAVGLADHVRGMAGGLDAVCADHGANFSLGQRQLFCIARAILTKAKVVVLDEATAAIDAKTDAMVQKAFAVNFADCTVLTIAHRLNTIIESDKVLFMDRGQVAEFDRPTTLLSNPDGAFSSLVAQTGPDSARKLRQLAQAKAEQDELRVLDEPHNDEAAFLDALARPVDPVD